jgi:hypothetical protein
MEDIESLSYDGENIYLMSSLSATKKGQFKKSRHLFAKVHRQGVSFQLENSIDLRESLLRALAQTTDPVLRDIYENRDSLEVEGHVTQGDDLFLALKGPLTMENENIILKVSSFLSVFEDGRITAQNISVVSKLRLRFPDRDIELGLTDMVLVNDEMFLASSCKGESCSAVWRMNMQTGALQLVAEFKIKHLEALALLPSTQELYGVFEGKKGSHAVRIKVK